MNLKRIELIEPSRSIRGLPDKTVGDFWRWAYSDVMSNANRSTLAEYIVAVALDVDHLPRIEWDAVDLSYKGEGIEVKASAYIQSWPQTRPSTIRFDIAPKLPWDSSKNSYGLIKGHSSACFVFCLLTPKQRSQADPLDLNKWQFYVNSTKLIEKYFPSQKSIGLGRLAQISNPVDFGSLREEVDRVLSL
jgi:hypothetical protein